MSCSWSEKLVAHVAGVLDSRDAAGLEEHLRTCPQCRETAEAQRAVWSALDDWCPAPPALDFDRKLYARIADDSARPWWHFTSRPWASAFGFRAGAPVAAACLVLAGAAFLYRARDAASFPEQTPVAVERNVDVEQVERTIDDLDMLKQMTVSVPAEDSESQT